MWLVLIAALTLVLAKGASPSAGPPQKGDRPRLELLLATAREVELPGDWATFLGAVAHHESRWYSSAHLASTSEVAASKSAWQRNRAQFAGCGIPDADYWIGSGGWYGLLPANGIVSAWKGTEGICVPPSAIFDPRLSTLMAASYARNLMGWQSFKQGPRTWLSLNRGWSAPGAMDRERPATDERFFKALSAMGIDRSFATRPVSPFPDNWHALRFL